MSENTFICRCEDVTKKDVQDLISKGINTVDEIKRLSRCGMGPCGGKTCGTLLISEIAASTGIKVPDIKPGEFRPPCKNVKLGILAKAGTEK